MNRYFLILIVALTVGYAIPLQSQTTIVLQPGPSEGKDVLLSTLDPDLNLYYDPDFCAVSWSFQGEPYIYRSLIEFDLSVIPGGSEIISATLYLSNNPNSTTNNGEHSSLSGSNACWLYRVTEEWGKYTVTWNNQPPVTEQNKVYLPYTLDPHQDYEVNVRQLIQDMIDNSATGHGFMYKLANEDGYRCTVFASSDHPTPELRPKLTITYLIRPMADFSFSNIGTTVTFNNQSLNAFSYLWDFGDGVQSIEENPVHVYQDFGDYEVTLIASKDELSDTVTKVVSVYLQTQTTIVLQPGPEDGKDVLLSTLDPDLNLYYDPDFCAVSWTFQGEPYIYRSLIEFNLSAIPAGATIINASLYLSNNPNSTTNNGEHSSLSGSNESWLSRVTEEWGKYSVTWNNQPSVTEENRVYLPNTLDPHQDFEVDVRQLIQDMIDNPASGHGFMYKLANEDGYRCTIFASSDHPNPELRPKLTITYILGPLADFTFSNAGTTVTFNNQSVNAQSYLWDFGDGVQSILENPVHEYQDFGDYEVTLIASKDELSDTVTKVVSVSLPPQTTIILQPGPEDGKDVLLSTLDPDLNLYYDPDFSAVSWTFQGEPYIYRSLIEFDLSIIPAGAAIINASLYLSNNPNSTTNNGEHASISGSNACWLSRVTEEWDKYTVTWNNQPPVTEENKVYLPYTLDPHQDYEVDVRQLIQDMIDNPASGHGFMYKLANEDGYRCTIFASSDHPNPELRPKLTITYILGPLADFSFSNAGKTVTFNNQSLDALSYLWDFGDGVQSILENPVHEYQDFGDYEVTLIASKDELSDTVTKVVSVYLQTQTTIVLQPGPEDGKDVLLSTLDPDLNLYYDPDFCAVSWTFQGEPYIYRSLIEFDLSAIPAGAAIINASLYLSNNPNSTTNNGEHSSLSGSNECWLSRVIEEWGKYSVTWNNQPSVTEENKVYLPYTLDPHQDFEVDVRQLIQDMIDNPASGHGFMYKLANEDGYRCTIFASSDHPNPELRPKLTITYTFLPQASFTYTISESEVTFTNTSFNSTSFLWDFGDGETSDIQNPLHFYEEIGEYQLQLIAYNDLGSDTIVELLDIITSSDQIMMDQISIYPNPAHEKIYLKIDSDDFNLLHYQLLNMQGQLIREDKLYLAGNGCFNSIDISHFEGGIYYFRFFNQEISLTKKVVIY